MPLCLFLLLAGLFGMHGLSDHGLPGGAANAMAAPMAEPAAHGVGQHTMAPQAMADHAMTHYTTAAPGEGPADARVEPGATGRHGSMGAMAGACLAMLVGLLLGLAGLLSVCRRPIDARPPRRTSRAKPRARDPDPPSLALLSVWRC